MILPDEILRLISEYSKPIGLRLDWKQGSFIKRHLLLELEYELNITKYYMFRLTHGLYGNYTNYLTLQLN